MSSRLTPERIAEMQKWLLEHPIDHEYDEMCAYNVLKEIGELPPGIE